MKIILVNLKSFMIKILTVSKLYEIVLITYMLNNVYLVRSRAAGITAGTNHQCGSGVHIRCGVRGGPSRDHVPSCTTPVQSSTNTVSHSLTPGKLRANVNVESWFSAF